MINETMLTCLSDYPDQDPQKLLEVMKVRYPKECESGDIKCFCESLKKVVHLYRTVDRDRISRSQHSRLMERLKKETN